MPETQAMADALLPSAPAAPAREPAAAPAADPPAPVRLPDPLPFVGPEAEVAALEQAWRQHTVVVLEGEGGIGKSRLAIDFAAAHGPYSLVCCLAGP